VLLFGPPGDVPGVLPVPCLLLIEPETLVPVVPCVPVVDPSPEFVPVVPLDAPSWPAEVPGEPPGAPAPVCATANEQLPTSTLKTIADLLISRCLMDFPQLKGPAISGAFRYRNYRPLLVPAVPLPPYSDDPVPLRDVGPPAVPLGLPPFGSRPIPVVPDMLWVPEVVPVVVPFMEPPVVLPLAAGPPAAELPPAEPPELCASARVLVSASVVAIAVVLNFMCSFLDVFVLW
jgi:hypothetical protein